MFTLNWTKIQPINCFLFHVALSLSCFFLSSFCLVRLNLLIDVSPYELVRYLNINECVTVYSECADCERTSSNCTPLSRVIYEGAWGLVTGWHAKQVKQRPKNRVDITFDVLRMRITYRPPSLDIFANINPSDFLGKLACHVICGLLGLRRGRCRLVPLRTLKRTRRKRSEIKGVSRKRLEGRLISHANCTESGRENKTFSNPKLSFSRKSSFENLSWLI